MINLFDVPRNDTESALAFLAEQSWTVSPFVWAMLLRLHDDDRRGAFLAEVDRLGPVTVTD